MPNTAFTLSLSIFATAFSVSEKLTPEAALIPHGAHGRLNEAAA
jgi:hypothetical protein